MASSVAVPLREWFETSYRPDCDWIDGELKERNVGEQAHASVQGYFTALFRLRGVEWGVRGFPEQRVQTSAEHYWVADVCVARRKVKPEPIVRTPPLLCIEVLSKGDSMSEMQERVEDYLMMGVAHVWIIDPRRRRAYTADHTGTLHFKGERLQIRGTSISAAVSEVFAELDEMDRMAGE